MDVNVTSIYRGAKAVWGHMRERGGGAILNTASVAGLIGTPAQVAYATSKGAVVMLTKCLALERRQGPDPGQLRLPRLGADADGRLSPLPARRSARVSRRGWRGLHPLGVGDPADIAGGFVYLASDEARWVTGIALTIDGGVSCGLVPE